MSDVSKQNAMKNAMMPRYVVRCDTKKADSDMLAENRHISMNSMV